MNEFTYLETEGKINDLINALLINDRQNSIRAIKEHAGEEYDHRDEIWKLAEMTDQQLLSNIQGIIEYFQEEIFDGLKQHFNN